MNPISVGAAAPATKPNQPGRGAGRTFVKALLLVGTLLGGGLAAVPAHASLQITTTGTITSGSETGGLFGLPDATTNLTGSYILTVTYDNLGPNYFNSGNGSFASDTEILPGIAGSVTATVNGVSVTTPLTNSLAALLFETQFGLSASNEGYDGSISTGAYVSASQDLSCAGNCVPYADLGTPFSYVLTALDSGTDAYTFNGAGFPASGVPTATFDGTETSLSLTVPEPTSLLMLATGLLWLGMLVRRRRA
jgi:hypothetical protein